MTGTALGRFTLHLALGNGEYAVNPPQVWHTADVADRAKVLLITAGAGAQHRVR